jgi:hypothetical protein
LMDDRARPGGGVPINPARFEQDGHGRAPGRHNRLDSTFPRRPRCNIWSVS